MYPGIANILLRYLTNPNTGTKGAELTFSELDTNQVELLNAILEFVASNTSLIASYNAGTTYKTSPPDTFVLYSGRIYKFVATEDKTGVTPGTDPAVWENKTEGYLVHYHGNKTSLDNLTEITGSFSSVGTSITPSTLNGAACSITYTEDGENSYLTIVHNKGIRCVNFITSNRVEYLKEEIDTNTLKIYLGNTLDASTIYFRIT